MSRILVATVRASESMGFGVSAMASAFAMGALSRTLNLYSDGWEVVDKSGLSLDSGDKSEIISAKPVSDGAEVTFTKKDKKRWLKSKENQGVVVWAGNKAPAEALNGIIEYWKNGIHDFALPQPTISSPVQYLGGMGTELPIQAEGTLWITPTGICMKSGNVFWMRGVDEITGIQIGGIGKFQTGGGWVGGGFGLQGALKGAAMAGMLNLMTTRVHNDCLMRLNFKDAELTFQILNLTPQELELALTPLRHHIENKSGQASSSTFGLKGVVESPQIQSDNQKDLATRLSELKSVLDAGLISEEEFNTAKNKILSEL